MATSADTATTADQTPISYQTLDWNQLLSDALTKAGTLSDTYCRFYTYSFTNQLLLLAQGAREPVATYKRWAQIGRQVKKGSKARAILRPLFRKEIDTDGEKVERFAGFKTVRCVFTYSETEGEEQPLPPIPSWSLSDALANLKIERVPFAELSGNIQGYSFERNIAISPVAPFPVKTAVHELAHILLGHTSRDLHDQPSYSRGVAEFQAEATALIVLRELHLEVAFNEAETRAYIQGWLASETPTDAAVRSVFAAVDKILRAGRQAAEDAGAAE